MQQPTRSLLLACLLAGAALSATAKGTFETSRDWVTYQTKNSRTAGSAAGDLSFTTDISLSNDQQPQYGASFNQLSVLIQPQTAQRLHIKIQPEGQKRWQVPESIVPRPKPVSGLSASSLLFEVQQPVRAAGQPFALTVTRKGTGKPVFDTSGHRFLFKDQVIELTTQVPADSHLYGLGEVTLPGGLMLPRDGKIITMWARDTAAAEQGVNTYGAHPFLLQLNKDGTAQGMVLLNSNGMDVVLNKTSVTFRAIGGLVELYLFLGPTPEEVIRQYHQVVGKPMMPPYWALGAQQGKWGYTNIEIVEQVVANYSAAGLPLEGLWVDIELLNNRFQVFTFDKDRFPAQRMRKFVEKLHAAGQRWAPIFNPGIATMPGYKAFEEGNAAGIWIKDVNNNPYRGQVWPGSVYYPSYLYPKTADWLKRQLQHMYNQVPFDGMWLDMTEAANFCTGMVCDIDPKNKTAMWALELPTPLDFNATIIGKLRCNCQMVCKKAPATDKIANPPYSIHNFGWKDGATNNDVRDQAIDGIPTERLDAKAISVTARHPDGTLEYDAHNLYGTAMAQQFSRAYKSISNNRPLMLTRSTFPGAGPYTGHWTGDTKTSWGSLQQATAGILSSNMWGLAMTGADICGYGIEGKATTLTVKQQEELCVRWTSAGAFYPLSRNHMNYFATPHEPYRWSSTTAAAKKAYGLRYRLLTYIYGSMSLAHRQGGTLARPLLFTDPSDLKARNATWQWMLGEALLVSPVVTNLTSVITPYFTAGSWYSAWDYTRLDSTGQAVKMDVPLGDIAVHLRGGAVIPMQQYAAVTRDVRFSPITLVVTLPGKPARKRVQDEAAGTGGPLPPYALEEPCADVHSSNVGKLMSCGLLYADSDAQVVSDATSTQVWLQAITEADGKSGDVISVIKAADPALKDKLRITELHVIGLAQKPADKQRSGHAGQGSRSSVGPPGKPAQQGNHRNTAQESFRGQGPLVVVASQADRGSGSGSRMAKASYDESKGVLKMHNLNLLASAPFTINWRL